MHCPRRLTVVMGGVNAQWANGLLLVRAPGPRVLLVLQNASDSASRARVVRLAPVRARLILGNLLGLLVRAWVGSLRVQFVAEGNDAWARRGPSVFAFGHGQQMLLLRMPRARPIVTMVSWSRDGALQAGVMPMLGISVVRGSATRGGAEGLRRLLLGLRSGCDGAFAVDGPRGPKGIAKRGALVAAQKSAGQLVVLGAAARRRWVLTRAWDDFEIPMPFSKVVIVARRLSGPPPSAEGLAAAIEKARSSAEYLLTLWAGPSPSVLTGNGASRGVE